LNRRTRRTGGGSHTESRVLPSRLVILHILAPPTFPFRAFVLSHVLLCTAYRKKMNTTATPPIGFLKRKKMDGWIIFYLNELITKDDNFFFRELGHVPKLIR